MDQAEKYPKFPQEGINHYVYRYIRSLPDLTGKTVLDIPCGDGRSSYEFLKKGANVQAFDLFPKFMKVKEIPAKYADLSETLPIESNSVDFVLCQEGIEHIPNQLRVFEEFNRILRKGGTLILTTPNYSHFRARLSHMFLESDFWKRMPPTEVDSVWFAEDQSDKIYFGHLFLIGVQKLQTLLSISGFEIEKRIRTDLGNTSLMTGLLMYPLVIAVSLMCWFLYRKKNEHIPKTVKDKVFRERFRLNISPKTLFCKHTFWIMKKKFEISEVALNLKSMSRLK